VGVHPKEVKTPASSSVADTTVEAVEEATIVVVAETPTTEAAVATVGVEVTPRLVLAATSSRPTTVALLQEEAMDTTSQTVV
jgi:hypothetical protein